jgi:hypothetical protein
LEVDMGLVVIKKGMEEDLEGLIGIASIISD